MNASIRLAKVLDYKTEFLQQADLHAAYKYADQAYC